MFRYYIGGSGIAQGQPAFPIATWNKFHETLNGEPRTNNTCEGFNNSWTHDMGPFPALWRVLDGFITRESMSRVTASEDLVKVNLNLPVY